MGAKLRFCERGGSNAELKRSHGAEKAASRRGPGGVAFHKNLTQKKGSYKMKTRKKLVSILCAAALLVSALPAASAVSAEPLSEYAGKTIPVQVVEETENGLTSRIISVAIPEGTTKVEEDALVCAVVGRASGKTRSSNAASGLYLIDGVSGAVTLRNNIEERIGGGTPAGASYSELDEITISFTVKEASQSETRVGFELKSMTTPSSTTGWKEIRLQSNVWKVVFYTGEFKSLSNYNNGIDVYAKAMRNEMAVISGISILGVKN